jgi:hypothetical protein
VEARVRTVPRREAAVPRISGTTATPDASSLHRIWFNQQRDSVAEKILLMTLASTACIGIGYGFSSIVDLAHWGSFNSWVSQMVG